MNTVYYSFKWPAGPEGVVVTGEFDEWKGSFNLEKSPTTGEFEITLPVRVPEKKDQVFFKFIVDGQWITSGLYKTAADPAGIENNYISKEELGRLAVEQKRDVSEKSADAGGVASVGAVAATPTKTRSAAEPQAGEAPEVLIARSSRNLEVKPTTPQSASSSANAHGSQQHHHHGHHKHSRDADHRHHHHHHHQHQHQQDPTSATTTTPSKGKESYAEPERDASYGAANAANAASAEFPTPSTDNDPLAATAATSALRKVKIKRKVKKNKKTGERVVVSEERIPLGDGEDEGALGDSTFEEEFSPPNRGGSGLSNAATGSATGSALSPAGLPAFVPGTETPTPTRQRQLQQQRGSLGSTNSPSNSPSIRKTRPLSAVGTATSKSPSTGPSRSGSIKERPVSSAGVPSSPSRPKSSVLVGSAGSSTAAAGANAATSGARKDFPSAVTGDSTPGSGRKTVSRGSSTKRNTYSPGANATGPLGTRPSTNVDDEAFHILPIEDQSQSRGDNAAFKSLAGEPGPFVPNSQDQMKAFSEVNDNIDPQAFNERLNKQYKAERNAPERRASRKSGEKLDEEASVGNVDKQVNATSLEKLGKSDALGKLKKDDNLGKLGKDAVQGKVDKNDAFGTLKNDKGNLTEIGKGIASDAKKGGGRGTSDATDASGAAGTAGTTDTAGSGSDSGSVGGAGAKDTLKKLGGDEDLKQLGKDAAQGKVNKDDALSKLGKDSTLKDAGKGAAAGSLGGGSLLGQSKNNSKSKSKSKGKGKGKSKSKSKESSQEVSKDDAGVSAVSGGSEGVEDRVFRGQDGEKSLKEKQGAQSGLEKPIGRRASGYIGDEDASHGKELKQTPKEEKAPGSSGITVDNGGTTGVEQYGYLPGKTAEQLDEDDFFAFGGVSGKSSAGGIASAPSSAPSGPVDVGAGGATGGAAGVDAVDKGKLASEGKTALDQDKGTGMREETPSLSTKANKEASSVGEKNGLDKEADLLSKEAGPLGKGKVDTTGASGVSKQRGTSVKKAPSTVESPKKKESRELQKKRELQERRELQEKKESEDRKKREIKRTRSQKNQGNLPTLDPRVRRSTAEPESAGAGATANPESSHQLYELDTDSDEGNEVYLDPMTRGTPEASGPYATKPTSRSAGSGSGVDSVGSTTASDAGVAGVADASGTGGGGLAAGPKGTTGKTSNTAPTATNKTNVAKDASPTRANRDSVVDSEVKRSKSLQRSKEAGPKRASSALKKEAKGATTKAAPESAVPTGGASNVGSTPGTKGATGSKGNKEISSDVLKQGKKEAELSKVKKAKDTATDLTKTGKSDLEGGKGQKEATKDVLKQGKSDAQTAKGKSPKGIVTDAAKTSKNEVETSKGKGARGVSSDAAATGKFETGEDATATSDAGKAGSPEASGRKSPAQSTVANVANRADRKKRIGLWARVKRILQ